MNSMNAFIGSTVQCRRIAGQLTHGEFSSVQVNIACVVMFMFPLVCPVQALLSTGVRSEPRENARARGGGKGEFFIYPWRDSCGSRETSVRLPKKDAMFSCTGHLTM